MTRLAEVKAERDIFERKASLYLIALQLVSRSFSPDAQHVITFDDARYVLAVYGVDRADGGIIITTFQHPGQADSVDAAYWEEWTPTMRARVGESAECTAFAVAAERLTAALTIAAERHKGVLHDRCDLANPVNGARCEMGRGHGGPCFVYASSERHADR